MNDILLKVQTYLDKCNKDSVDISDTLVEEFGEACKSALRKQFSEKRREGFKPRMSSIGRPLCQLQMEAKNVKGEGGILKVHHHIHLIENLEVGLKRLQKTMRLDMYLKDIFIVKVRRCLLVDGL